MVGVYYNENDKNAIAWLRTLIRARYLPAGEVDDRSIINVRGTDIAGFDQCHFFAGIGGWPLALELAGWRGRVWTGSCPCQPFSNAGQQRGTSDERHLWPEFQRLIAECKPSVVFGEQVASKAGRVWLAGVRADLEALGYGVGAADLCAAGVGAPHIRQRLFWVANAGGERREWGENAVKSADEGAAERTESVPDLERSGVFGGSADANQERHDRGGPRGTGWDEPAYHGNDSWSGAEWLVCLDGKARRVEPGTFPLAHGVPARVGRLRGYGNAIVPQVAAEFIGTFMEIR